MSPTYITRFAGSAARLSLCVLVMLSPASQEVAAQEGADRPVAPQADRRRIEPSVVVHPNDPRLVLVGASDANPDPEGRQRPAAFLSRDRGKSFELAAHLTHPPGVVHSADVSIAYDAMGRAFLAFIGVGQPIVEQAGGLLVGRSRDGGETWSSPTFVSRHVRTSTKCLFEDWPTLAADPKTPTLYVVWQRVIESGRDCGEIHGNRIFLSRSIDGGKTFSRPVRVSGRKLHADIAADIAVGPGGAVYISYLRLLESGQDCPRTDDISIYVAKSTDRGRTFTRSLVETDTCGGESPNMMGSNNRYSTATTISVNPVTGNPVVAWHDRDAPGQTIHVRMSSDRGARWEQGTIGNPMTDVLQAPQLAHGAGGVLFVHFVKTGPADTYDTMLATSSDDGRTWTEPIQLTSQSSQPIDKDLGEYIGLAVGNDGTAHPVWTDVRSYPNAPNIWTRPVFLRG